MIVINNNDQQQNELIIEKQTLLCQKEEKEKKYDEVKNVLEDIRARLEKIKLLESTKDEAENMKAIEAYCWKVGGVAYPVVVIMAKIMLEDVALLDTMMTVGILDVLLTGFISSLIIWDYSDIQKKIRILATKETLEDEKQKENIVLYEQELTKEKSIVERELNQIKKQLSAIEAIEELLVENQSEQHDQIMNDSLPERMDYTDINFEGSPDVQNIHNNCGKKLSKTYSKNKIS